MCSSIGFLFALWWGSVPAATLADSTPWAPPQGFVEQATGIAPPETPPEISSERVWTRRSNDLTEQIVEARTRRPLSLRGYLELWRRNHGCAVKPVRGITPLSWAGEKQTSLTGSCEGGDVFVMHVAQVGDAFYEFHVGQQAGPVQLAGVDAYRDALNRLLGEVGRVVATDRAHKGRSVSRAEARRRIEKLAMVRAFGDAVRLRGLEDGADIGPRTCTGSEGECLYWFRAETQKEGRWGFWRLFGVCPYDGDMFISTTPDLSRVYRGSYQRLGDRYSGSSSGSGVVRGVPRSPFVDLDDPAR